MVRESPDRDVKFRVPREVQRVLHAHDSVLSMMGSLEYGTHSEREVDWEPADRILRDMILSLGMNAEPDVFIKDRLEIPREAVQNPCVGYVKVQIGKPRVMTIRHGEP